MRPGAAGSTTLPRPCFFASGPTQPCYHSVMTIRPPAALGAALALLLTGCNPTYNWREYASPDAAWHATFPAKPATTTRTIDLDGMQVAMTMTAAEVEGATFAVGSAEAPDAARARAALDTMRLALARNIGAAATGAQASATSAAINVEGTHAGVPMRLVGRFEARGTRFYQAIVVGPSAAMPAEQVDQFLTSFAVRLTPGPTP